jgi:transposase InsO family protein
MVVATTLDRGGCNIHSKATYRSIWTAAIVLAETINGLYKAEVIHRRGPWRSFEAVEFATLEWVDWFNSRLLEPIGNLPPAEAEAAYYAQLELTCIAA